MISKFDNIEYTRIYHNIIMIINLYNVIINKLRLHLCTTFAYLMRRQTKLSSDKFYFELTGTYVFNFFGIIINVR